MDVRHRFIEMGTRAEGGGGQAGRVPGEIWIDVGDRACDGVLDHHAHSDAFGSATELALHRWDDLVGRPFAGWSGPVTIATHQRTDLDACACTWYVGQAHRKDRPRNGPLGRVSNLGRSGIWKERSGWPGVAGGVRGGDWAVWWRPPGGEG